MKLINRFCTENESNKFEYQLLKTNITFLDTEICTNNLNYVNARTYRAKMVDKNCSNY